MHSRAAMGIVSCLVLRRMLKEGVLLTLLGITAPIME